MPSVTENLESVDVSDLVDILNSLKLSVVPQDYVDQVMSSYYSYYSLPESYESLVLPDIDFSSIINDSCELLNSYLYKKPSSYIEWNQLIDDVTYSIHPKPLSCLLNCFIQNGIKDIHECCSRKDGLSATRLFFLASTFKGSKNIGFYHVNILSKCSELIKSCVAMLNNTEDLHNGEDKPLNEDDYNDLMATIMAIVQDLRIMVKRFQFFDDICSLELIIDVLIDIVRLEKNSSNIFNEVPTKTLSFSKLAFLAYSCLMDMFNENCGSTFDISQKIMFYILPGLLVDEQREMQLTTRQFNALRDHHLAFMRILTEKLGASFGNVLEIVLQHLLHRGPDRSELKPRQFQIILEVWRLCPNNVRIKTKYYLLRLVYHVDFKLRSVALETLFKVLSEPEETESDNPELLPLMPATKHEFIVAVILSKFQDPSLTVRAKAFSLFVTLTAPNATTHQTALIKRVLVDPYIQIEYLNQTSFSKNDFHEFHQYLENNMTNFNPNSINDLKIYPGAKVLIWTLNVHAHDERAHIRRLSLTLLCNIFLVNKKLMEKYCFKLLVKSCSDTVMTIRKVAVSGLTDLLLKYPDNQNVLKYWFEGLIHLVGDHDKRIQELAVECMNRVILKNIKPYSAKLIDSNDPIDYLPWRVLDIAINEKVGKYMMSLCESWGINKMLTDGIVKDIMTYVGSSNHDWTLHSLYLLQLISHQLKFTNMSPIIKYYDLHFNSWISNEDPVELNKSLTQAQIVMDILFLNYKKLDKATSQQLLDKFENLLFNFEAPTRLISKSLDLYTVLQSDNHVDRDIKLKDLFKDICNHIEKFTNTTNEEILMRYIFTLGDIGLVQHLRIERKYQEYLLGILNKSNEAASSALQAIVVLAVGKLSIVDEQFAKDAIIQFGVILRNSYHPSIKINTLTALADLCLRCTTLVEQAIPEICVCLKAESLSVKRIALKHLTGLILEDYIKLRDVAFFALLCMLEDPDLQVREETSSFIVNYLLIKHKNIMERKLIEVIFHFNGYEGIRACEIDIGFSNLELKAFFSMEGDSKKPSRHAVYRFMLSHMLDDSKLKLTVKLFTVFEQIIKNVAENSDARERANQVMKDAFWILKAKEMTLTSGKPRDNNNDDDPETLEKVTDLAKRHLVMETYKKVMIDYIIPGVLKLKYEIEKRKKIFGSLLSDIRAYLCSLTSGKSSPLKTEIINLLSTDSELISEILYDNKQMKQQKQHKHPDYLGEYESEEDDDDDDDDELNFMQDIEYVTWAQMVDKRDEAKELGFDEPEREQLLDDLESKTSEMSLTKDDLEEAAATNFSQLTGAPAPVKEKSKKRDKKNSFVKGKQMKFSHTN